VIRLFAAIAPPPDIAAGLVRRQTGLPGARWRPEANLHLTLRFFGDIAETLAEDLDSELAAVGGEAFDIVLSGVGSFGEGAELNALWVGVEPSEPLARLARRCETAARRAGLKADTRAFHPHVTLAYLRGADPARVAAWIQAESLLKSPPFRVTAFGLYSSWRSETGSAYQLERRYPLG
jgi:2'-5' RNA ligase